MPQISWNRMITDHPAAHLVVGIVVGTLDGESTTQAESLVSQLLAMSKFRGNYSVEGVTRDGVPEVQSIFAELDDANLFAEAIGAEALGRHSKWASQRTFRLDSDLCQEIASSLALVREWTLSEERRG